VTRHSDDVTASVTRHMTSEAETVTCHITKVCKRESDPKTGPGWWVCHECNFVWSDAIAQGDKNLRPKLCIERSARVAPKERPRWPRCHSHDHDHEPGKDAHRARRKKGTGCPLYPRKLPRQSPTGTSAWARNGHCAQRFAATFFNLPIHAHNALETPASSTMWRAALNNRHGRNRWRRRKKSQPSRKSGTKVLRLGKEMALRRPK
jgi:hypothetical protein